MSVLAYRVEVKRKTGHQRAREASSSKRHQGESDCSDLGLVGARMELEYVVGDRVDGLYDGNSDDMWYPGRIQCVKSADPPTFQVQYDDGEIEHAVALEFIRLHVAGTISVGTRVFGRYAGGDEWYPGKITEVQEHGLYTIEYDDTEVEHDIPIEFIQEPPEESRTSIANSQDNDTEDLTVVKQQHDILLLATYEHVASESGIEVSKEPERAPSQPVLPPLERPNQVQDPQEEIMQSKSYPRQPDPPQLTTHEHANIVEAIQLLGKRLADSITTKSVLSTLVKQLRAFPQVTADLVHEYDGEKLLIDVLKFHSSHAVIQCYGFVLLRRLCFLCLKSTHIFLRSGIIDLVTIAMRKFIEDAILQASACGALAVFTRVHAGLTMLLDHRVADLVLATILYHKTYSVHTRQVHYYACEGTCTCVQNVES